MHGLKSTASQVWDAFEKGGFVVQNSDIPFTAISVDHAGEQVNKILKVNGGLVCISHNVNARDRFFLTAPYIANITKEMKIAGKIADNSCNKPNQLSTSIQAKRYENVQNLRDVFANHGITFEKHTLNPALKKKSRLSRFLVTLYTERCLLVKSWKDCIRA